MGALLIHLTGGRIETHFHVFGSLAFLAFYRDWRVLVPATVVVALDHLLRGMFWPQSVYGVVVASEWRWLEHAAWVVFEDMFLVVACLRSVGGDAADRRTHRRRSSTRSAPGRTRRTTRATPTRATTRSSKSRSTASSLVDATGHIVQFNPGGRSRRSATPSSEAIGRNVADLMVPAGQARCATAQRCTSTSRRRRHDAESPRRADRRSARAARSSPSRWRSRRSPPWARRCLPATCATSPSASTPKRSWRGRPATCRTRTIAERRNAAQLASLVEELRLTQRQAEAATRAKSEFLASMSHELRTPLNAIILYSELLQEEAKDRESDGSIPDLQRIQFAGKHLLDLINGILDLSKIEAGKMAPRARALRRQGDDRRARRQPSARWSSKNNNVLTVRLRRRRRHDVRAISRRRGRSCSTC